MTAYSALPDKELVSLNAIHSDWIQPPGASLGAPAVTELLMSNSRINRKVVETVLQDHNLLYDEVLECSYDDAVAARLVFEDLDRFATQVGLVLYGDYLANMIDRSGLGPLTERFDMQDLRRAVRLRSQSSFRDERQFGPEQFPDIVLAAGKLCLLAWSESVPYSLQGRVQLIFPKRLAEGLHYFKQRCQAADAVVRAVAQNVGQTSAQGGGFAR